MGRKSKLTDAQWQEVERRMASGESKASLAREFKITEAAIRQRKSLAVETIKAVANQILAAETALKELPIASQMVVISLADELRAISTHLAGAAKFGAATAHRLAGIANAEVQKIDDADPLNSESLEALKGVAALTKIANDSSYIAVNLLNANKETIKGLNESGKETGPPALVVHIAHDAA